MTKFPLNPEIKVSYNSTLIYPGISLGAGFLIKEKEVFEKKGKPILRSFLRSQLVTVNTSWYHHPGFHDNLYFTSEWVLRKMRRNSIYTEFSAGPGFSRTFLGGTTYLVRDDGTVAIRKNAGYNYALVTIGWGSGYDFSKVKGVPLSIFAKMNLLTMFPYNSTVYFRPVFEVGARLNPGFFSEFRKKLNTNTIPN